MEDFENDPGYLASHAETAPESGRPAVKAANEEPKPSPLRAPEVELYLLATAVADSARLDMLTPELFATVEAGYIYAAARRLTDAGRPVDVPLLVEELKLTKAPPKARGLLDRVAAGLPTLDPANFDEHLAVAEGLAFRRSIVSGAQLVAGGALLGDDVLEDVEHLARTAAGGTSSSLPSSWLPVSMVEAVTGEYVPELPTVGLVGDTLPLFYAGRVNALNGESGVGKGLVSLAVVAQRLVAGETIAMLDYEDTEHSVAGRLRAMGVPVEAILERFIYIRPDEALPPAGCVALCRMFRERDVTLVLIDTVGEAMALDGINPNADDEVARWFRMLPRRIAHEAGAAVVLVDHVPKPQPGQSVLNLFAIGSQRKRAALDGAGYMLTAVRSPARGVDGLLKLTTAKDRHGARTVGSIAAEVTVLSNDAGTELAITFGGSTTPVAGDGKWKPTGYMERLSEQMELSGKTLSRLQCTKLISGKDKHILRALDLLVDEGFGTKVPNAIQGRFDGFKHVRRYVESEDSELSDGDPI